MSGARAYASSSIGRAKRVWMYDTVRGVRYIVQRCAAVFENRHISQAFDGLASRLRRKSGGSSRVVSFFLRPARPDFYAGRVHQMRNYCLTLIIALTLAFAASGSMAAQQQDNRNRNDPRPEKTPVKVPEKDKKGNNSDNRNRDSRGNRPPG